MNDVSLQILSNNNMKERKYFDSGDFAVSAAGNLKTSNGAVKVGAAHPQRGSISPVPKYSNVNEDANEYLHDKKSDNLTQYSSPLHQQGDQNENISNRQT